MSFYGQSQNTGVSRPASGGSSRRPSVEDAQPSSSGTATTASRPITRSLLKSQQMQPSTNSQPPVNSSLTSLSSLSSSTSSLNSMDTTQFENKLSSFQSSETDCFLNILNQESSFAEKLKPIDLSLKKNESTHQKILIDETPMNIVSLIERTRMSGRNNRSLINLPNSTLSFLTQRFQMHDYPLLIKRLDQSSIIQNLRYGSPELDDLIIILRVGFIKKIVLLKFFI
ncbi:hypothetical protein BpHYR1_029983 [Brachionus plicatilis]|uniref:Uncharacterized protein n=1 Tax=Brachionus plicatilis TaxID=10195 RepID=A0A3M7QTI4_BRAPC|nr:hypothetical protein BpHYR1_029983 [Brachionus plicatilis]